MKIILEHLSSLFLKMYYVFIEGSLWWSSGWDCALALQGACASSLVWELEEREREFPSLFWASCGADTLNKFSFVITVSS